jgi:hypothetical protein
MGRRFSYQFKGLGAGCLVVLAGLSLALSSATAQAALDSGLFLRLVSRFESPAVRLLMEESGVGQSVLGRAVRSSEDYAELARLLSVDDAAQAGRALEGRLQSQRDVLSHLDDLERMGGRFSTSALVKARLEVERLAESQAFRFFPDEFKVARSNSYAGARDQFIGANAQAPRAVPLSELNATHAVSAAQTARLADDIVKPLSQVEFAEEVKFLAGQFKITEGEILSRLQQNRLTMRELMERAQGIKPAKGMSSIRTAVMEKLRLGLADRRMANPEFVRYVATLVATEIVVTVISERTARGDDFWRELDYFTADLITFTLAEIVLTWVTHARASSVLSLRGGKPQASTIFDPGFTAAERGAALMRTGTMLGTAGFALGIVGNGTVEIGKAIRERDDPSAPDAMQRLERVLWNAFLCGSFMAVSSNLRYQAVSKVAMMVQQRLKLPGSVQSGLLMGLSYGNSFIGATTYVFYADIATPGMQETLKQMGFDVRLGE